MFVYEVYPELRYAWIRRVMVSWRNDELSIGFYPDWEHCAFQVALWAGWKIR